MAASNLSRTPQVEGHGIFERRLLGWNCVISGGVAQTLEPGEASRLCLVGIDRKGLIVATAWMCDVVDAAAKRATTPAIIDVEGERRLHRDGRMQRGRQLPGLEADAGSIFLRASGRGERNPAAIAGDDVARSVEPLRLDLQSLDRGSHKTRGGTGRALLAQHVPWLQRLPELELDATATRSAVEGEAEFPLRFIPDRVEAIAGVAQIGEHAKEVLPDKVAEHEAVMQGGTPAHKAALLRLPPEPGHQRPQQQLLRETHARVWRHLERSKLHQAKPAGRTVGRKQLVDADLRPVRVAGDVDQQMAEQTIDQPRQWLRPVSRSRHGCHRDLQLIEQVVPCFVDAWRLAGRANEKAGKEIGQRGMLLKIENQALQKVRTAQERAVGCSLSAQHNVVAPAGSGVAAVDHELVGAEAT